MESLSVKIFFRLIVIAVCAVVRPLSLQSAGYGEGNLNFYHIGIDAGLSEPEGVEQQKAECRGLH